MLYEVITIMAGLILGFFISIAEPGLMVLAGQVNEVTGGVISGMTILLTVSVGLAIMLAIGFFRVYYNIPLYLILLGLYSIIFIMSFFTSGEFLAISFDASGSTTGILAVPFILALSLGISTWERTRASTWRRWRRCWRAAGRSSGRAGPVPATWTSGSRTGRAGRRSYNFV